MTREEAIQYIDGLHVVPCEQLKEFCDERNEAIDMAIEALSVANLKEEFESVGMTREEAIKWLTNEKWTNANNKYKKEWNEAFDMAIEALSADTIPIEKYHELQHQFVMLGATFADLTEVVWCKDCRHAYFKDFDKYCPYMVSALKPDGYCSYGEKKNENSNKEKV